MGINRVILVGFVGKDPDTQTIKEDTKVSKFTLATSETYRDKAGEKQTTTEWHNIVVWKGLAGVVEQYVKKGSQLYVEGKLTTRSYEKDGNTKYFTEIVANNIEMLGSNNSEIKPENQDNSAKNVDNDDDLPF